jgi:hypothetical protein
MRQNFSWVVLAVMAVFVAGCQSGMHTENGKASTAPTSSAESTQASSGVASPSSAATSGPQAVSSEPPCAALSCTAGATTALGDGYTVRIWISPAPTAASPQEANATPVVQLLHDGTPTQWYTAALGSAWSAKLTCSTRGAEPTCVVTSPEGAHAGSAEFIQLHDGKLVGSPRGRVVFDTGAPYALDLNGDGVPDVVGLDNTYQPNYVSGQNYWASYRYANGALTETGCADQTSPHQPPPNHLLTGACPKTPGPNE